MPIEIIVPRLGWSMEEGAFVAWLKKDGESVRAGEPLFSIEGDKAVQEIESLDNGILRIAPAAPKPGEPVRVGDILGHLLLPGEAEAATHSPGPVPAQATATESVRSAEAAKPSPGVAGEGGVRTGSTGARTPAISPRALRAAAALNVDWTKVMGTGRTGRIRERDIRAAAGLED